jgi:hypothetical protein
VIRRYKDFRNQCAKAAFVLRRGAPFLAAPVFVVTAMAAIAWVHVSRSLDSHLADYGGALLLYSAPAYISVGDPTTAEEIVADLRLAGYTDGPANPIGFYRVYPDSVEVNPGPRSYAPGNRVRIRFMNGKIDGLSLPNTQASVSRYGLEPQPLGRVADGLIERFHPVRFQDVPKVLVAALLSAEDKRFYSHPGFDSLRLLKAAWVNVRRGR